MNSNVNNKTEIASTLSIKEMIGFIVIVGSSLYLLYPKGDIEKLLDKNKEENTQLSIDYLNSMLIHQPDNPELKHKLIKKYHLNGELDKALILTREFIGKTKDSYELKKLYKSEYILLKEQYFQLKSEDKKDGIIQLKEKLNHLFSYAKDVDDYNFLLTESTSMDFKELRYKSFTYLLKKEPITLKLKEDAVRFFISHHKIEEAEPLVIDLLEKENNQLKRLEYFKTAFYILAQDKVKNIKKIEKIIHLYKDKSPIKREDLYLLSNVYLQINQKKEAAEFIYSNFKNNQEIFDEKSAYEAVRILSYNAQLKRALEVSSFIDEKYPSKKSLDSKIQFSTWLSKADDVVELNTEGWQVYKDDKKYQKYLLEKTSFDNAYKIRGKIYKQAIINGNFSMIKELGEYYEYTGEIEKAEKHFNALVKKYPKKSIYEEAIRFSHDNGNFKNVDNLYRNYRKKFGINREIHKKLIDEYIVSKQLENAYLFTKELKELSKKPKKNQKNKVAVHGHNHGKHKPPETNYSVILKQLAWISQDYQYLYSLLWSEEGNFSKNKNSYAALINLESKLSKKPRLQYLYKKAWETTNDRSYLPLLLSLYIDKKEYKKFEDTLTSLKLEDRSALEKHSYFHILLANYYQGILQYKNALTSFKKAINLEPNNSDVHQAYIWFLLNKNYYAELKNELNILKKDKALQEKIALPSVIAALKLDKSDLAYKWLKPIIKHDKKNLEYQSLYADILEYQGEKDKAKAIRFKLFRTMHRQVESSEELLKDKEFAQLYLQMALSYKFPYSKKIHYMKKFKSLFSQEEYLEIELSFYSSHNMLRKVDYLITKHKIDNPSLNLYLATQRRDKEFANKAYKEDQSRFSLKEKISIAIDSNHKDDAYTLLFKGMNDNQNSISLATAYWGLINDEFPKSKFSLGSEHLSTNLTLNSMKYSKRYALNTNFDLEINLLQNNYIQKNHNNLQERAFGLSLGNHDSKLLWSLNLGRYFGDNTYNYSQLMLHYDFDYASVGLNINKNNKIKLTPKLQVNGLQDSVKLDFTYNINERNTVGLSYQESDYHLKTGNALGKGEIIQLSNTQQFRLGYPDVTLFNHLNIENFDFEDKKMGLSSFTEIGSEITVGANVKDHLQKSWKPYVSLGVALNDHKQIGTSLTVGAAGMAYRADKLDISLQYTKGVNNLDEELYGAYLNYSY